MSDASWLDEAFEEFLRDYRDAPVTLWSEADVAFRLATCLARRFPGRVHMEFPIAQWTRHDVDKEVDKRQFVDVVVTGEGLVGDHTIWSELPTHTHTLFAEVKWLPRGSGTRWRFDHIRKVGAVNRDAQRLARHLELGRCRHAAVFVADHDGLFESEYQSLSWPPEVRLFIARPSATVEIAPAP